MTLGRDLLSSPERHDILGPIFPDAGSLKLAHGAGELGKASGISHIERNYLQLSLCGAKLVMEGCAPIWMAVMMMPSLTYPLNIEQMRVVTSTPRFIRLSSDEKRIDEAA